MLKFGTSDGKALYILKSYLFWASRGHIESFDVLFEIDGISHHNCIVNASIEFNVGNVGVIMFAGVSSERNHLDWLHDFALDCFRAVWDIFTVNCQLSSRSLPGSTNSVPLAIVVRFRRMPQFGGVS